MLRVGIVANEPSGDILGASLIRALKVLRPDAVFEGVAGPRMIAEGCTSLFPMERLSVMGLVEVLRHLPELLRLRRQLVRHFIDNPPDIFIGIDAPDFNLGLERRLKQQGIPTVHYVCPTVWAWRAGRVKKIRSAVDLLLCIFPFEPDFVEPYGIRAAYVGHPLADEIPLQADPVQARAELGLPPAGPMIALLPGSRLSEIEALAELFIGTAARCAEHHPDLHFVVPLINDRVRVRFAEILHRVQPDLPITLIDGHSQQVMQAADLVLTASGTATLEALLLKRPMVVAYRLNRLTYWIIDTFNLVKVPYVAMANLLTREPLAPEFIQDAATVGALADALSDLLQQPDRVAHIRDAYREAHLGMRQDAGTKSAAAVLELLDAC